MTRAQLWAKRALAKVLFRKGRNEEKSYRTLCMKTPILLKQSGPVQALAFLRARDSNSSPGKDYADDLAFVFLGETDNEPGLRLLQRAHDTQDLAAYLALSSDLIEVSMWFRRFAQAELRSDEETDEPAEAGDPS